MSQPSLEHPSLEGHGLAKVLPMESVTAIFLLLVTVVRIVVTKVTSGAAAIPTKINYTLGTVGTQ